MSKRLPILLLLCLLFTLSGCQKQSPAFSIEEDQIQSIDVFTGGVPSAAVKKAVTSSDDIQKIARKLSGISLLSKSEDRDIPAGGIGLYFKLNLSDETCQLFHIIGDGDLIRTESGLYKIKKINTADLWENLNYEEVKAEENELPTVTYSGILLDQSVTDTDTLNDLPPMVMLDGSIYIDTGQESPMGAADAVSGKILSAVEGTKRPSEDGQSNFGCVGNNYVLNDDYAVININEKWILFRKEKSKLTLDNVIELSKKGDSLSLSDLSPYEGTDVGSGLYILSYEINDDFYLLAGSTGPENPPMYVRLVYADDREQYIDIRDNDVESWIDEMKSTAP
ncbi:hypothetical protein GPL15_05650 [Clostridium sp. MCC353]|uniref:hypothetical protein n=1 Tax=Clostridium sp. MCC353 TaxID=2592646 RepID=UPI001C014BF6|nr:hypothetical protein [Clostridium sp. MCC353]MBT9775987.1 hypothetical protein [Clostridium sp. MCC353]